MVKEISLILREKFWAKWWPALRGTASNISFSKNGFTTCQFLKSHKNYGDPQHSFEASSGISSDRFNFPVLLNGAKKCVK
jgi:hypothetical protein